MVGSAPQALSLQYKGRPVPAFQVPVSRSATSTNYVDVQAYNALHVDVYILATGASFDIAIEGSNSASGVYLPLSDPNATRTGITTSQTYNAYVGASFVRVVLSNVTGTFAAGQGIQVWLTPYIAGGTNIISQVSLANENIVSVNGAPIYLSQATMQYSLPVVIASNQTTVPVTVPVGQAAMAASTPVAIASNQTAIPVTVPVGQGLMAASTPVVIASNQSAVLTYQTSATATNTAPAVSQTSTQLLAANTSRRGATIYNDATVFTYLKLGASASVTDFSIVLQAKTTNVGGYYEVPFGYTGIISAILGAVGTGNWRVSELT